MSEWIPFFQSLVWPVFLAIFLVLARKQVIEVLAIIVRRVEQDERVVAGPLTLERERKLTRLKEEDFEAEEPAQDASLQHERTVLESVEKTPKDTLSRYMDVIYLQHSVRGPQIDPDGVERYAVHVIVDADSEDILDQVERVVYHLHPTFPNPDRESTDRKRFFGLRTRAWGEFNLSADVYFKGYKEPLTLYRYLNIFS